MASELNETLSRAADFLEQYAAFIHRVKPGEIEEHPYLPELEQIAADVRALSSPNNHTSSPTGGGAESHLPRRATDDEIRGWMERHDLGSMSLTDARCVFEDAQSLHLADGVPGSDARLREIDQALAALADVKPLADYGQPGTYDTVQARRKRALEQAEQSLLNLRRALTADGAKGPDHG